MNLSAVSKLGHAMAALLVTAVLSGAVQAGSTSTHSVPAEPSAVQAAIPAAVAQARSKFTIVDQKVTLSPAPSADLSATSNAGHTAQSNSAAQSGIRTSAGRSSADQSTRLNAATESQLTASTSAASAQVPAGTRARAFARNAQASAAYAGTQQQTRTLNGIKLIAAPYLTEPEHAALTRGTSLLPSAGSRRWRALDGCGRANLKWRLH